MEAAEGREIRRNGFLPAISSPGRQPQGSAGSGRSNEEQSCEFGDEGSSLAAGGGGPRAIRLKRLPKAAQVRQVGGEAAVVMGALEEVQVAP